MVYLSPPQAYLVPCEKSVFSGGTYGDAVDFLLVVIAERDLCASQVEKMREWQSQVKTGHK